MGISITWITDDLVLDSGLYDDCTEPTRGNNRLDKILCSDEIYFNGIKRFTSTLRTDHMGLVAYHGVEQSEKRVVYFRDHRIANKNYLNYLLDTHDLSYFLNYNDPNVLLRELSNELLNLYKVACPLQRVVVSSRDPPFMTPVIKYLLRKKHRHTRRGKLSEANAVGLQVRMLITKRAFSDSSGRNWWQRVNTFLNKNKIAPDRTCKQLSSLTSTIMASPLLLEAHSRLLIWRIQMTIWGLQKTTNDK